jgi:hypothetical protein
VERDSCEKCLLGNLHTKCSSRLSHLTSSRRTSPASTAPCSAAHPVSVSPAELCWRAPEGRDEYMPCAARQPSRTLRATTESAAAVPGLALHFGRVRACGHRRVLALLQLTDFGRVPRCLLVCAPFPRCAAAAGFTVTDSFNTTMPSSWDVDTRYGGTPLLLTQPQRQRLISRATSFLALTTWERSLCSALSFSHKRFSRWRGQPCPIFTCPSSLVYAFGCAGGAGTSGFEGGATPVADCSYGTCSAGKMVMIPIM